MKIISQQIDKTLIKELVERELESKLKSLNYKLPTQKEIYSSKNSEELLKLKNEIIDLKTIIAKLQDEQKQDLKKLEEQQKIS